MNFQGSSETVHRVAKQTKIPRVQQKERQVCIEKTKNQKKMIRLAGLLDKEYVI